MRTVIADGPTLWEVEGVTLHPIRYEARLTEDERERAQAILALGAVFETLSIATRWHGRPVEVEA